MLINIALLYVFIFSFSVYTMDTSLSISKKSKILILTSQGGRGHTSVTEALHGYLDELYTVHDVNVLTDVLSSLDIIKKISNTLQSISRYAVTGFGTMLSQMSQVSIYPHMMTNSDPLLGETIQKFFNEYVDKNFFKQFGSEDYYNLLLRNEQKVLLQVMNIVGQPFLKSQKPQALPLIRTYIDMKKPDLIISVVPLFNDVTAAVAEEKKIPLWIIPTDFDATMFVENLGPLGGKDVFINIVFSDPIVSDIIKKTRLNQNQYTYIGMPVREQFLNSLLKQNNFKVDFKKQHSIPNQKMVVMVMLGGRGSPEIVVMAQALAKIKRDIHFLLCIGKADELKIPLEKIIETSGMSAEVVGFTHEIAQYMAISDLFITKSGGQTVCEALYMQLPVLLDVRSKALPWEELNRTFVSAKNVGALLPDLNSLVSVVQKIIDTPEQLKIWRRNIINLNLPNPKIGVQETVKQILSHGRFE